MKKILFLVNDGKISSNENGGASVYFSHLELLYTSGYEIHLLALQWEDTPIENDNFYSEIKNKTASITFFQPIKKNESIKIHTRFFNAIFQPELFEYSFLNKLNKDYLNQFVEKNKIEIIWAEWRWAGMLAWKMETKKPVVYAHHDWEYKLAKLRKKRSLLQKIHTFQKKRVEFKLVKGVTACVTGSDTERLEISKISKKTTLYLPTTYSSVTQVLPENDFPNIVHLGGMGTTANRLGLERFLDVCWDQIKIKHPNCILKVIGSLKGAHKSLLQKLEDPNIHCLGFIKDLSEVLFPKDLHIIPWEYNTGTRTRLPLIFNYEQVLVATIESVKALPEIQHQKNAILSANLEAMAQDILKIISNKNEINRLSKAGKATFFDTFTNESQQKKMQQFLENL